MALAYYRLVPFVADSHLHTDLMLVSKAGAHPSETFQPYFKDKTRVYMADSYQGTSLLQDGAFCSCQPLTYNLSACEQHWSIP
jgi:hypothetical protein